MTSMELFEILGNARDTYVAEVQKIRTGETPVKISGIPKKRMLLIAAIVALTLLLVGCAVVYVLRMQDMKVGEYSHYVPENQYPNDTQMETSGPITIISLQGTHLEAMAEWIAFVEEYDSDHMIAVEAQSTGTTGNIPEQYSVTYGCHTQEMVDKLDEIAKKYDLKLLSTKIQFTQQESSTALQALGIGGVCHESAQIMYLDGYYYPEGTFELNLSFSLNGKDWQCTDNLATYRYSRKDYFDPVYGAVSDPDAYTQWDYTRKDGNKVLLAMNKEFARIYVNLPDSFISISMEACEWETGGVRIPMTKRGLEEIAELLDLTIQPQLANDIKKPEVFSPVKMDAEEYAEIVADYIAKIPNPENGSYLMYDLNGDGIEELLINGWGIYSMQNGVPYEYMDRDKMLTILPMMRPCEGNIVEIYLETDGVLAEDAWYFYRAEQLSIAYIVGVTYNNRTDVWTLIPDDNPWTENNRQIPEAEAKQILDAYTRVEFVWRPVKKYGEPYTPVAYSDPYARYISQMMDRFDEALEYQYMLMDLNGDGVEELITRDNQVQEPYDQESLRLNIHTIEDGKVKKLADGIYHICEGGILEETEEYSDPRDPGEFWRYSRLTENGLELIEKIVRDPITLVWGRVEAGKEGRDVTEAEAMGVVNSYRAKRIELDMKPFSEYPFQ